MLPRLAATGSGFPTVYIGEMALHSRYNPPGEAEKYINSLQFREGVRFFILLEPGLAYTVAPLRKRFPHADILSLHVSDFFTGGKDAGAMAWSPGLGKPLQRFLEEHLPDTEAASVAIVEWRPSQAAFGESYLKVFAETVEYIKRADANKRTLDNFGRRWFKNVFKNLRLLKKSLRYHPFPFPIVIAGAGPSLEQTIPLLVEQKKHAPLFILAVSSAVPALFAANLPPDLIITTDGGNWALLHLYESLRTEAGTPPAFAAALTAALPSQFARLPWLPIGDASLWQNILLCSTGLPFVSFPQRGTVTATALDLAFQLSRGPVYITGVDLGRRDIRTHARPYSFERLVTEGASRFNPAYSQTFVRSSAEAASGAGGSLGIYAQWFARQMAAYPDRLFSLGNNNAVFNERRIDMFNRKTTPAPDFPEAIAEIVLPNDKQSSKTLSEPLLRALESDETGETLRRELGPLLFPGEAASVEAIRETIGEVSNG
ncbi:hypothetical protein AGMMS49942_09420 [Spirochaetia bacterium]|nr:hypothetical protein AGMMS49942_09420 [Spirochaetia bacterium]